MPNTLYYGDNLKILQEHITGESVDLIYLDPPFKSDQNYNVLFAEKDGTKSAAQIHAFEDTWEWDEGSDAAYRKVVELGGSVSKVMQAFRAFLGDNDMLAYLSMMAPRLVELRRVMKPTGSIYLHCDPTASHYLKLLMDAVFSPINFRNEITWKRRVGMSSAIHESNRFGVITDNILMYAKSDEAAFHPQYNKDSPEYQKYIAERFTMVDEQGRRFQPDNLTNPSYRPNLIYEYKGYLPPKNGWAISREKMEKWDREGRLYFPPDKTKRIRRKRFVDELKGMPIQNLWTDIPPINSQAQERLGYPTQKPEALLERIIKASSNEGDLVLDPFCGCGTAISAAQKLNRSWIGMDITHLAITLIKHRLYTAFGTTEYNVVGEPEDVTGAEALAESDKYQFQWWALGLVHARPDHSQQKKGPDKGIDGRLYFHDDAESAQTKQIVFSVKAGKLKADDIRALHHVVDREKATLGALLTLHEPSHGMRSDALSAGVYVSPWGTSHPVLQIITVADLLGGKKLDMPPSKDLRTFKNAPKAKPLTTDKQAELPGF